MSGHAKEVREVLAPALEGVQDALGPLLWDRLKRAADDVYAICEHEDEEAAVSVDLMHELMNEVEDR